MKRKKSERAAAKAAAAQAPKPPKRTRYRTDTARKALREQYLPLVYEHAVGLWEGGEDKDDAEIGTEIARMAVTMADCLAIEVLRYDDKMRERHGAGLPTDPTDPAFTTVFEIPRDGSPTSEAMHALLENAAEADIELKAEVSKIIT